ncbi:MAG TPA: MFS transporter [Xanthobacteraceae bacterium]|jgi:EmrB/QacA subfamily drug resistance transporter|nr:MFS transporter [Xanthobacteraceae bacterium]
MTSEIVPEDKPRIAADAPGKARAAAYSDAGTSSDTEPSAAQPLDHSAARAIIFGIMLAMFLSALEQTIVAPALPAIGKSLGGIDDLPWVVTAYLLAATAATPLFGKLSDIYGRRAIMLTAILVFVIGSVACALAPSIWILIAARALQGIGGGGLLPIAQTVIGDLLSPRERPAVMGHMSIMFVAASALGPVLGGLLTDHLHWSLIFWINLPLGLIALATTDRALRKLPRHDRRHELDVLGAAAMVAAALSLMFALAWGGTYYPWGSWPVVSLFAASAILWCLFALRLLSAREPFIPLAILGGRVTGTIICAAFFSVGTIIGVTIYTPLYCQTVLGISASQSGLILIAFMIGTVIASQATMRLMVRMTHYMRIPMVSLTMAIIALGFLAASPAGYSWPEFAFLLFVLGLGLGPMYPMSTLVTQNSVKPPQMGTATGALNFFRTLGGAIIVAVFGALVLGGASDGSEVMTLEKVAAAHRNLAPAFQNVFIAAIIFIAIALCCLLIVEERPMQGPRLVDAGIE